MTHRYINVSKIEIKKEREKEGKNENKFKN